MPLLEPYLESLSQGDLTAGLVIFFALLIAHALCDHPLQGEYVALRKNRHYQPPRDEEPHYTIWPYCLSVHALIHGGAVWIVTGSVALGFAETLLHWAIDFFKAEKVYNIHVDQFLHILCKVGYVVYLGYAS